MLTQLDESCMFLVYHKILMSSPEFKNDPESLTAIEDIRSLY